MELLVLPCWPSNPSACAGRIVQPLSNDDTAHTGVLAHISMCCRQHAKCRARQSHDTAHKSCQYCLSYGHVKCKSKQLHKRLVCQTVHLLALCCTCLAQQAFPNLEAVKQLAPWPPALFCSLCQHCPMLRHLDASEGFAEVPDSDSQEDSDDGVVGHYESMPTMVPPPLPERLAAIRALAKLQSLEQLSMNLDVCIELSVLARQGPQQLKVLRLVFDDSRSTAAAGLMSLAVLKQLQLLVLELPRYATDLLLTPYELQSVLGALSGGPAVRLLLPEATQRWVLKAVEEARQLGMDLPRDLSFGEPQRLW